MRKAGEMERDYAFLDLEDAVAPSEKIQTRQKTVWALNKLDFGRTVRSVRINDLETHLAYEDIIEVVEGARENVDVIIIPKAKSAFDVQWVALLLDQMESKLGMQKKIGLEVLTEEVEGMANVEEIASSSPRLEALILVSVIIRRRKESAVTCSRSPTTTPAIPGTTAVTKSP